MGIARLIRRDGANTFERGAAAALFTQFLCILSFFALAQRYSADLYPFLIFCFIIFLCSGSATLVRSRHVIVGLIGLSIIVNSLTTVSWLIGPDQNVPTETRGAWEKLLGRHSSESQNHHDGERNE
jgi:hypothetical protein